jgi:hypothetical protein
MPLIESIRIRWRLNSAMAEMERTKDVSALVQFLLAHPEKGSRVEEVALARNVNNYNHEALLFTIALATAKSPHALKPIKKLIEHSLNTSLARTWPIPWKKLSTEQIRYLCEYVSEFDSPLLEDLFRSLSVDIFVFAIEESVLANKVDRRMLEASAKLAGELWKEGKTAVALDLLTTLVLADPDAPAPSWLEEVALQLPNLEGLSRIRAANLLRQFPDKMWIPPLKETWVDLERNLIENYQRLTNDAGGGSIRAAMERNAATEYGAASVAIALGMSAACDSEYVELEDNYETKELDDLIDRRNALASRHSALAREYHLPAATPGRREEIEEELIEIQNQIKEMDAQIEQLRKAARMQYSPGRLLALVLQDEQSFPAAVRQAAAWGLFKIIDLGKLNETSREKLRSLIRQCTFDRDFSDLSDQIQSLNLDKEVESAVLHAAQEHQELRNWPKLISQLTALNLDGQLREHLQAVIRNFENEASPSHHFQERIVQFTEGQRLLEFEQSILDGLVWMLDLIEEQEDGEGSSSEWNYQEVREIVHTIWEQIPKAQEFLSRYPLRLMTSKQQATIMGKFSRTKAGITRWTRYTPPLWRRGAPPEQVGKVRKRYHELDDRSAPNAMGISWRLFAHRVLAVPVIYHEFMHYGGPSGDPKQGISNECEVHLREAIFTRELIAQMAPKRDEEIPEYERRLGSLMRKSGQRESLLRLLIDFKEDSALEFLNMQIKAAYGAAMSEPEARAEISRIEEFENLSIRMLNATDEMKRNWQPEIEWPLLNTPLTRALSDNFYKVLYRSLTSSQTMSEERRDAVLGEPAQAHFQKDWEAYVRRNHALSGFLREIR